MEKTKNKKVTNSQGYKLIEKHGLETVRKSWEKFGMYEAGRQLGASPYVLRHLSHKYGWKRPAENCQNILLGVQRGVLDPANFQHLDWSNVEINSNKKENGGSHE